MFIRVVTLQKTFAQAPPPPTFPHPHILPHSRGFPVTSGHCILLGDGSVSLAGSLQWQSTGQRRTENEFLPAGEATLERGAKGGLGEACGRSYALESRDPRWSRRQRSRAAGSQKSLGRDARIKCRPPRPPPASARRVSTRSPLLGLCNPGTWQPEEGRLGKREEKRGGTPGSGDGKHRLWRGPSVSFRKIPALPHPVTLPPPQFPLSLLSVPTFLAGGSGSGQISLPGCSFPPKVLGFAA